MGNQHRRVAATEHAPPAAVASSSSSDIENITVLELLRDGGFSFTREVMEAFADRVGEAVGMKLAEVVERYQERDAYDLDSAAARSSVGRSTLQEAIADDELDARYIGKKKTKPVIPAGELQEWLNKRLPTESGGAA